MTWHRVDFLDGGSARASVGLKRMRKGHGINLVDGPRPSLDFSSGHIDHDNRTVVRVENN